VRLPVLYARLTPLDGDGTPRHREAHAQRWKAEAHETIPESPAFGEACDRYVPRAARLSLPADDRYPVPAGVLARGLLVGVELWDYSPETDEWLYVLYPCVRLEDAEDGDLSGECRPGPRWGRGVHPVTLDPHGAPCLPLDPVPAEAFRRMSVGAAPPVTGDVLAELQAEAPFVLDLSGGNLRPHEGCGCQDGGQEEGTGS